MSFNFQEVGFSDTPSKGGGGKVLRRFNTSYILNHLQPVVRWLTPFNSTVLLRHGLRCYMYVVIVSQRLFSSPCGDRLCIFTNRNACIKIRFYFININSYKRKCASVECRIRELSLYNPRNVRLLSGVKPSGESENCRCTIQEIFVCCLA